METGHINYIQSTSTPNSLQNLAIVPIVAKLLCQPDIKKELLHLQNKVECDRRRQWNGLQDKSKKFIVSGTYKFTEIEKRVEEKLRKMHIPRRLEPHILGFVKIMSMELLKCLGLEELESKLYTSIEHNAFIQWTGCGQIDKIKTLDIWFTKEKQEKNLDLMFEIACKCFYEKYIYEIWELMPLELKEKYRYERPLVLKNLYNFHFSYYWICVITNEPSVFSDYIFENDENNVYKRENTIYMNMFALSILNGNLSGVKYLWDKMTQEERKNNIIPWLETMLNIPDTPLTHINPGPNEKTDIIVFLLSNLENKRQQEKIFLYYPNTILKYLYRSWPWQRFFMKTLNEMWDFIEFDLYMEIIRHLVEEDSDAYSATISLEEVYNCSPARFKEICLLHCYRNPNVMKRILQIEDDDVILQFLEDVFGRIFALESIVIYMAYSLENYELIDKYLHRNIDSSEEITNFKKEFMKTQFFQAVCFMKPKTDQLENFLRYFLCTDDEVMKIRNELNDSYDENVKRESTSFRWPTSNDTIFQFKKKMLFTEGGIYLFQKLIITLCREIIENSSVDFRNYKHFIQMFSPWSNDVVVELKSKLEDRFSSESVADENVLIKCKNSLFCTLNHMISNNGGCYYDDSYTLFLLKNYLKDNKRKKMEVEENSNSCNDQDFENLSNCKLPEQKQAKSLKASISDGSKRRKKNRLRKMERKFQEYPMSSNSDGFENISRDRLLEQNEVENIRASKSMRKQFKNKKLKKCYTVNNCDLTDSECNQEDDLSSVQNRKEDCADNLSSVQNWNEDGEDSLISVQSRNEGSGSNQSITQNSNSVNPSSLIARANSDYLKDMDVYDHDPEESEDFEQLEEYDNDNINNSIPIHSDSSEGSRSMLALNILIMNFLETK